MELPKMMISVETAAELIGVTVSRVRQMLRAEQLAGVKLSERAWIVDERSAKRAAKTPHSVGRPRTGSK
jgi:hypothetical protein